VVTQLLQVASLDAAVKDASGATPFATAIARRHHVAARAILQRDPRAAQQVGGGELG
jgi:hypothetical protein